MNIKIFYIGKDKKNFFSDEEKIYLTRIKHYLAIELSPIKPEKIAASSPVQTIRKKEEILFEKHLGAYKQVILLDENGKLNDSISFAKMVESKMSQGLKTLCFVLGGAHGFSDSMKKKYQQKISLSKLTFPHHLARLVLLEQLYRAMTIMNNEPYHNN